MQCYRQRHTKARRCSSRRLVQKIWWLILLLIHSSGIGQQLKEFKTVTEVLMTSNPADSDSISKWTKIMQYCHCSSQDHKYRGLMIGPRICCCPLHKEVFSKVSFAYICRCEIITRQWNHYFLSWIITPAYAQRAAVRDCSFAAVLITFFPRHKDKCFCTSLPLRRRISTKHLAQ